MPADGHVWERKFIFLIDNARRLIYISVILALRFPKQSQASVSPMPLTICEPYAWYLVVTCKHCGARQPIHRDSSEGRAELLRKYTTRCVQCGQTDTYEPDEIERYQHVVERRKKQR